MTGPIEFDCTDCGLHVYAFGIYSMPTTPRCAGCAFLATIPDLEERAELRAEFLKRDLIGR